MLVVGQWPPQDGHYPVAAYQAAFGLSAALRVAALAWFAIPWIRTLCKNLSHSMLAEREPVPFIMPIELPVIDWHEEAAW